MSGQRQRQVILRFALRLILSLATMSLESLVLTYGYPLLFIGVLIEGEAFLIVGAYLAHQG